MNNNGSDVKDREALKARIMELKKKRGALIVAHNYQRDEIQDIADIIGDSYALAREVTLASEDTIVFCGVKFMAESAHILSPEKTILLPVEEAGCPLADMVTVEELKKKKEEYPDAAVVCYVNSSAAVKAESDICCTSSSAIDIVRVLDQKRILFVPDKNLGRYVQEHVPEKEIILWDGYCIVHMRLKLKDLLKAKELYPDAEFIAHPECREEVLEEANFIGSTAAMVTYAGKSKSKEFIVGTEAGIIHRMKKLDPGKKFHLPTDQFVCVNMKLTTLEWLARSLEKMVYKVEVPEETARRARLVLQRMMDVTQGKKITI